MKVIIFARENNPMNNNIIRQMEICQNFADFFDYEVVGVATELITLFETPESYDAVLVTKYDRISRDLQEYALVKRMLLDKERIIIQAVRSN